MAMGPLDMTTVNLVPRLLKMSQAIDMPIFCLTDWKLDYKWVGGEKQGISMVVVMKRKITSEMMTTYFPSLLLTAITFATTFFKPFFFEAALSVNLTTMLVMTTIFISKMEGLPPTSNVKMIDYWLVICQMVPFAEVVLLTAMEYQRTEDNEDVTMSKCMKVVPVNKEEIENEETDIKRWYQRLNPRVMLIPSLKTLGNIERIFFSFHRFHRFTPFVFQKRRCSHR